MGLKMGQRDAEAGLWTNFEEFVTEGSLFSFTDHAGIDLRDVQAERVWDNSKAHYTRNNRIDMDHFPKDFTTWGPIMPTVWEACPHRVRP